LDWSEQGFPMELIVNFVLLMILPGHSIRLYSLIVALTRACCREEMPRPSGQWREDNVSAVDFSSPLPPPTKVVPAQLTAAEAKSRWPSQNGEPSR
jgi:hypothetical protein